VVQALSPVSALAIWREAGIPPGYIGVYEDLSDFPSLECTERVRWLLALIDFVSIKCLARFRE
jgi:hypothetical protein